MGAWKRECETFGGLAENTAPGTHRACVELVQQHVGTRENYLELAIGYGSLAARMANLGFRTIDGVDIDTSQCKFPEAKLHQLDLNSKFSKDLGSYRFISAVEIIEHLDNPRHFLKEVKKLMDKDSFLLLSTPNIQHWLSRLKFLITGEHRYFGPGDYHVQRHISPLSHFQLECIYKELGFTVQAHCTAGQSWGSLKKLIFSPLVLFGKCLKGYNEDGEVNIYLLKPVS